MTEDLKELAELQPESKFVIVKGESFEIKPFKFKQFFAVLSHISNMIGDINPYEDPSLQIVRLIGKHSDDVLGILGIAINKPASFFDEDVDVEEGLDLAISVYKINEDFFTRKIQPKLEKAGIKLNQEQSDLPSEKEKNISPTDTAEKTEESPEASQ